MGSYRREVAVDVSEDAFDVLYVVLSAQPKRSYIPDVRNQLTDLFRGDDFPLIRDTFYFHPQYHHCPVIDDAITAMVVSGLMSSWSDGTWEIKSSLHVEAGHAQTRFLETDVEYLHSIGERLKVR